LPYIEIISNHINRFFKEVKAYNKKLIT
jgi:hypothetical protein